MTAKIVRYSVGERGERPWGDWLVLEAGPGFIVKRIRVAPGHHLSLQRHQHRDEQWVIASGRARVRRGEEEFFLGVGQAVRIGRGDVHRVGNEGDEDMVFIEVQTGPILDEADIERLEDKYGRT